MQFTGEPSRCDEAAYALVLATQGGGLYVLVPVSTSRWAIAGHANTADAELPYAEPVSTTQELLALDSRETAVACGTSSGVVLVYSVSRTICSPGPASVPFGVTLTLRHSLHTDGGHVYAIVFTESRSGASRATSPPLLLLLAGTLTGRLIAWNSVSGDRIFDLPGAHGGAIHGIVCGADRIYTASWDQTVRMWERQDAHHQPPLQPQSLSSPSSAGAVQPPTGPMPWLQQRRAFRAHSWGVTCMHWDGSDTLFTGGPDMMVRAWDAMLEPCTLSQAEAWAPGVARANGPGRAWHRRVPLMRTSERHARCRRRAVRRSTAIPPAIQRRRRRAGHGRGHAGRVHGYERICNSCQRADDVGPPSTTATAAAIITTSCSSSTIGSQVVSGSPCCQRRSARSACLWALTSGVRDRP